MIFHELIPASSWKWRMATEPFVHEKGKCILISFPIPVSTKLLWCHIGGSSKRVSCHGRKCGFRNPGDSKVAEKQATILIQEYVLWLHVAVGDAAVIGIG
jgi:hypothetical protein